MSQVAAANQVHPTHHRRSSVCEDCSGRAGAQCAGSVAGFFSPRMRLNRELCLAEIRAALRPGAWRAHPRDSQATGGEDWVPSHAVRLLERLQPQAGGGAHRSRGGARELASAAGDRRRHRAALLQLAALNGELLNGLRVRLRAMLQGSDDGVEAEAADTALSVAIRGLASGVVTASRPVNEPEPIRAASAATDMEIVMRAAAMTRAAAAAAAAVAAAAAAAAAVAAAAAS